MIKVCAFGDSILKGIVLDSNGKYVVEKSNFSKICEEELNIQVENYGKFGSTIDVGEKSFERHAKNISECKYALLEFGGNDCDFNWKEISISPDVLHAPKSSILEFKDKYIKLVQKAIDMKLKPVILSLPPIDAKKYFKTITKGLNAENILKFLKGNVEYISYWHEMYNNKVKEIAMELKVPLVDITSAFLEQKDYSNFLCEDGIHPNKLGHELIARAIKNCIKVNIADIFA